MRIPPSRVMKRVLEKVVVGDSGCHLSTYSTGSHGYAQVGWQEPDGRMVAELCHRVVWCWTYGDIPDSMTVDHICHVRQCVNPEHLRLLSNVKNASDNGMATKTHCPKGHEYSPENTNVYTNPNTGYTCRKCLACQKISNDERTRKKALK